MREAVDLTIQGIVQGVGFRPFVYRSAHEFGITGWVLNGTFGVKVHAEGAPDALNAFIMHVHDNAPAAAHIAEIQIDEGSLEPCEDFKIIASDQDESQKTTLVSADLATCAECERELFDPENRRYRYPFINCTNCGPRFTIIDKLPYDRCHTSMASFPMCAACEEEYTNPLNRRFHAQPDACWSCGPYLSLAQRSGGAAGEDSPYEITWGTTREKSDALLAQAVRLLKQGGILAVKGLGGFHLVCDAENPEALATLRQRKRREGKPFAVMMKDVETVRAFCQVSEDEAQLLSGSVRPIVLLRLLSSTRLAPGLADGLYELGVMLPYTPVQLLLMHDFAAAGGRMLVMTSGNIHDEPIVTDDEKALSTLGGIADAILGNNRAIRARYDDSVVRVLDFGQAGSALQFVRRARGYAPTPLHVTEPFAAADGACVCATGPEQKTTACFLREGDAFVTQHVGDMENAPVNDAWFETIKRYEQLFKMQPTLLACDKHPEYLTTKWAREQELPRVEVQHHHAHIVSALAENGIAQAALGFAFDGTGYGEDGAIWGGEALLCNVTDFERFGNFAYVPMPGGAAAVKNPLRMAYGVLWAYDLLEHPSAQQALAPLGNMTQLLNQMIESSLNTPYTSSVGRLFDAASALLGICPNPAYESEGAVLLEAAAARALWEQGEGELHSEATQSSSRSPSPCSSPTHLSVNVSSDEDAARASRLPDSGCNSKDAPVEYSENCELGGRSVKRSEGCAASTHLSVNVSSDEDAARAVGCDFGGALVNHSESCKFEGDSVKRSEGCEASERSFAESPSVGAASERNFAKAPLGNKQFDPRYSISIEKNVATKSSTAQDTSVLIFDAAPTFAALLDDLQADVPVGLIALRFHNAFVELIVNVAQLFRALYGISLVALSGGVFLNRYLMEHAVPALADAGFTVVLNREVPPSDGCISLGQAVVAYATGSRMQQKQSEGSCAWEGSSQKG